MTIIPDPKTPPSVSYKESLFKRLLNLEYAAGYLEEVAQTGDRKALQRAIRDVAEARCGGMSDLAEKTNLNRSGLYRSLSEEGEPQFETILKVLEATGIAIHFKPRASSAG